MKKIIITIGILVWGFGNIDIKAQSLRMIAILDVDSSNGYSSPSYMNAVSQMLKVCGFPYFVTTHVDSATLASMILVSSRLTSTTFTSTEKIAIENFVSNGGIIVGSAVNTNDPFLKNLFGYSSFMEDSLLHQFIFTSSATDIGMRWINDSMEQHVSLSEDTVVSPIKIIYYTPDTGVTVAARYENGEAALLIRQQNKGYAVTFGTQFRDLFSFAQQDNDARAERAYSNFFEPGYDPLIFFIKDFYASHMRLAVWKHTIPNKKNTAVLLTHDMDSKTSNDRAIPFAQFERSRGITAIYNITARYFSDYIMGSIYDMDARRQLDSAYRVFGMVLGSHSVGHFPDMDDESVFPLGSRFGNDTNTYRPRFGIATGTVNGTLYGEALVSKKLIEESCHCKVRSFRTGYLTFHNQLINALDSSGYDFNSSMSANDVMSHFPYRTRTNRSHNGELTNVYEIPLTISDVFQGEAISDSNYLSKLEIWKSVTDKVSANFAPVNLLIHPNRDYKLDMLQRYVTYLNPAVTDYLGFENYGDFWKYRDSLHFITSLDSNLLSIEIDSSFLPIKYKLGFVIDKAKTYSDSIIIKVVSSNGDLVPYFVYPWYDSSLYVMFEPYTIGVPSSIVTVPTLPSNISDFRVYPNPFSQHVMIDVFADEPGRSYLEVLSLDGKIVFSDAYWLQEDENQIEIKELDKLNTGSYVFILRTKSRTYQTTMVKGY